MKILHIITSLLDGGAEGVLFRICSHDKNNKHLVISLRGNGKYGKLLLKKGIKIYTLNMQPGKFSISSFFKLIKILKKEQPNIVQTWLYHSDFFGGVATRVAGIKNLIWNIRHSDFDKKHTKKKLLILIKILAKISSFLPKRIIFCSKKSIKLHKKIGYQANKIEYVPNGYDTKKFKPYTKKDINDVDHKTLLGCVARLHPQKDHKTLLHALNIVKKKYVVNFKCILVGLGMEKKNLKITNLIKKYNLEKEILLIGSRKNINTIMRKIDIHILASSYGEAFPNVIAEAMASGTPCVATNVGDTSLIVGNTGWITKPNNPKLLAKKIVQAIKKSRSKEWKNQCKIARDRIVKNFSIKRMTDNYNKIWLKTVKHNY